MLSTSSAQCNPSASSPSAHSLHNVTDSEWTADESSADASQLRGTCATDDWTRSQALLAPDSGSQRAPSSALLPHGWFCEPLSLSIVRAAVKAPRCLRGQRCAAGAHRPEQHLFEEAPRHLAALRSALCIHVDAVFSSVTEAVEPGFKLRGRPAGLHANSSAALACAKGRMMDCSSREQVLSLMRTAERAPDLVV